MAKYHEYITYFENLSALNQEIQHVPGDENNKRFFRMSLEELLSGSFRGFGAGSLAKPIFVFVNYITDYKYGAGTRKQQQIMFWVIKSFKKGDYQSEMLAKSNAEDVVESFLSRMREDSENNHPIFQHSFDKIDNVRTAPVDYSTATGLFVGLQVSITLNKPFGKCYDPNEW